MMTTLSKARVLFAVAAIVLAGLFCIQAYHRQMSRKAQASTYAKALIVMDETNTALMQVDAGKTTIYDPNRAALRMFGYQLNEMDGMDVSRLIPAWYRDYHETKMKNSMQMAAKGETMYRIVTMDCKALHKDGTEMNVFVRIYIGRTGVVAFINLASQAKFVRMPAPADAKP